MLRRLLLPALLLALPGARVASAGECRVLDVDYLPAKGNNPDHTLNLPLSIVAWLETPGGEFIETIYITQEVGTYGLGNRPGRYDFNSGPVWPYGRRITTFPVWAHRHGLEWARIDFQDDYDDGLSHATQISSIERHYFRPMMRSEPMWDAESHSSSFGPFTDKGKFGPSKSLYPPRQDIMKGAEDAPSVLMYDELNPFDGISQASPASGQPARFSWAAPMDLPTGSYVLWMEVSREFDHNGTYTPAARPGPNVPYGEYGLPYRGQPSVLYKVPLEIDNTMTMATTDAYAGYGDPDGQDGVVRAPDSTITTNVPGSGAQRLALVPGGNYRVRVAAGPDPDSLAPAGTGDIASTTTASTAVVTFVAPGDDERMGMVKGYEIRYLTGEDITPANFASAIEVRPTFQIAPGGSLQTMTFDKLLPETTYSIGIQAYDNCGNTSPLAVVNVTTNARPVGEVDACFVATAAYGTVLANDVEMLRRFRDLAMKHSVLGELAVETYYTFGPSFSGVVGESDLLRHTAREALKPIVERVKRWTY
ncbi:MAG: hypothetical protein H0T46_30095 [Deltaproteobacteria bacterium]|nr:hypothetical protein [Deltaproteobacteria bacterium]